MLDKGHLGDLGTSHLVARQELRGLVAALRLPGAAVQPAEALVGGHVRRLMAPDHAQRHAEVVEAMGMPMSMWVI